MENKKNNLGIFISSFVALLTGVLGTYLLLNDGIIRGDTSKVSDGKTATTIKNVNITDNGIADAVDKIYDAVVVVASYKNDTVISTGTGFVYKKNGDLGYIMTNNHVVDGADKVVVTFSNDNEVVANVVGKETYSDIAVLAVDVKSVLLIANIGDSSKMRLGDTVFTVGSPLGVEYSGTVTRGILSGKNRLVEVSMSNSSSTDWYMKTLQTDAAINPGNSGGPLLNVNGEVIGINSLKLVENEVEGMGFAIPIEDALTYASILEKGEKVVRPYFGIYMDDLNAGYYFKGNGTGIKIDSSITKGVVVTKVEEGSPASAASLQSGDVIISIDDDEVRSVASFRYELYKRTAGDKIVIKFYRGTEIKSVNVILTSNNS